jgi:hypothetical protein
MSAANKLTPLAHRFLQPSNSTHRQYEALRAYFVEGLPSAEAAARFGYSPGSFRVLVHQFRQHPQRGFFLTPAKGPQTAPKSQPLRERVVALRGNCHHSEVTQVPALGGHPLPVTLAGNPLLRRLPWAKNRRCTATATDGPSRPGRRLDAPGR